MRRMAVIVLGVAILAVGAALLYTILAREAQYGRLIADGDSALAAEQTFVAVENFSGAIALKPDSMLAYLRRGEAYRRYDLQKALRDLRVAAQLDPSAPRPQEELGDVNYALERFARAAESYTAYLALDDRAAGVWYKLALSRFRLGNASTAIPALRHAVALKDRFPEAYYLLGVCQGQVGQTADAVASLQKAAELGPGLSAPREELVRLLVQLNRETDAIRELEKLAAFEPTKPDHLIEAGLIYARLGRTDLAVTELNRAAEREGAQPRVYQALGRIWLEAAQARHDRVSLNKAVEALDRVARSPDATSEGLTLYGRALVESGDVVRAQQAFDQALQKTPVDPAAYLESASLAQRRGDLLLARDALVRYLALTTDTANSRDLPERIGDLCLRLGDAQQATRWLQQAVDASDNDAVTAERLAAMQLRAGDRAGAAATVDKGLKRAPSSASLLALKRRLESDR